MATDKVDQLRNRVTKQEKTIVNTALDLARTVTGAVPVGRDMGLTDYEIVKRLAPLLDQMGAVGDMCRAQIEWHDGAYAAAKASPSGGGVLAQKGIRDKDD